MSHLPRREFLATAGAGVATLALAPAASAAAAVAQKDKKVTLFNLPKLPYKYDALEPHIDAQTMEIHWDRHHRGYLNGLNAAIQKEPSLSGKSPGTLLRELTKLKVPEAVRTQVRNMGGGFLNHNIFWEIMGPKKGGQPTGALAAAIEKAFKNFDAFKKVFSQMAATQFGSGWAWLVLSAKKELQVVQRPNQDSPYIDGLIPLLGLDVWEHAYYLKYKNERPRYIEAWWNVVNWDVVANRYNTHKN
jgi:Fe-Mn family superoxide dismutase